MPTSSLQFNSKSIESEINELIEQTEEALAKIPFETIDHSTCNFTMYITAMGPIPNDDYRQYGDNFRLRANFEKEFDLSSQTLREVFYDADGSIKPLFGLHFKWSEPPYPPYDPLASGIKPGLSDCYGDISIKIKGFVPKDLYNPEDNENFYDEDDLAFYYYKDGSSFHYRNGCDLDKETLHEVFCNYDRYSSVDPSLRLGISCNKFYLSNDGDYRLRSTVSDSVSSYDPSVSGIKPGECNANVTASVSIIGPVPFELNSSEFDQILYDDSTRPLTLHTHYKNDYTDNNAPAYFESSTSGSVSFGNTLAVSPLLHS